MLKPVQWINAKKAPKTGKDTLVWKATNKREGFPYIAHYDQKQWQRSRGPWWLTNITHAAEINAPNAKGPVLWQSLGNEPETSRNYPILTWCSNALCSFPVVGFLNEANEWDSEDFHIEPYTPSHWALIVRPARGNSQ